MTDPTWYRRSYRRNLVDMHIEDWDPAFLSQFDPDKYFALLQTAQVQSAMIYLQSHVGHCNWDTASGHTHATFTDCTRKMQRLFDLCHGAGMDVIAYYSLIYNNDAYVEHPDWRLRDINGHSTRFDRGQGQYFGGSRYGLCCPSNPGYRDFVLAQVEEVPHLTLHKHKDMLADQGIAVSHDTVWRFLKREGRSFKKNRVRQ